MKQTTDLVPREYQSQILNLTKEYVFNHKNVLVELDCGLGKRYLQYALIKEFFPKKKILLILQASTSLYETYNYFKFHLPDMDIEIIDSRLPSKLRTLKLKQHQVILTLPQTLSNTLRKYSDAIVEFEIVIINEVDQLVKRMGTSDVLKQPYPKLMPYFGDKIIIGMSGTLRDNHYIIDNEQVKIKQELQTLLKFIENTVIITMDMLDHTDVNDYITISKVYPTGIIDHRLESITSILEDHIDRSKNELLQYLKTYYPELYFEVKRDYSKLFGPLPVPPKLAQRFHKGYLTRKYLWSMPGQSCYKHLVNYGINTKDLKDKLPRIPGKFMAVRVLVQNYNKSVILCSYLDTVAILEQLINGIGIETIVITGKKSQKHRVDALNQFRKSNNQMVAILSDVGERDLDIPEAELLIVFDLVRTIKTVYQKLKRSRGGDCLILYYKNTNEKKKVNSVLQKIREKYYWSTKILPETSAEILNN